MPDEDRRVEKPEPPPEGWKGPDEIPYVDDLPLIAWISWTLQKAGYTTEDPLAALLCFAARDATEADDDGFSAMVVKDATRRAADLLDRLEGERVDLPDHKCERIADLSPRMTGPEREMWVGRLLEPIEGYPEEKWCLHVRTPEKPEVVFGHNIADWEFMAVLSLAALRRHINPRWLERMAESAYRAAGKESPDFDRSALYRRTHQTPEEGEGGIGWALRCPMCGWEGDDTDPIPSCPTCGSALMADPPPQEAE